MLRRLAWRRALGLTALLGCVAGVGTTYATTATLVADTHVSTAQPSMNFGTLTNLDVGNGYTALLQFDLSTLPGGTTAAQVSKATLRVFVNRVDTAGTLTLAPVQASWGEYSVTASAGPAIGQTVGTLGPVTTAGSYVTVDVTTVVQGWLATPNSNQGLALTAATAVVQLDAKENDVTSHPATLDITVVNQGPSGVQGPAGAAGAQGPQGPAGATGSQGPAGAQGQAGAAGTAGVQGPQGPAGATGPQGPAGVMNYQGVWSSLITYPANAVVTYAGSSYLALVSGSKGSTPGLNPTVWGLLAAAGQNGTNGASGSDGGSSLNYQGAYSAGTSYSAGAVVVLNGSSYVSLTASNVGNAPNSSAAYWGLLAAAGANAVATGSAGQSLQYQGTYAAGTNYALGDIVQYSGSSYVSLLASNHGNQPSSAPTAWGLLAAAQTGPAGPTGAQGVQGLSGPAGPAGATGPSGAAGPSGATGPAGSPGLVYRGAYSSTTNYGLGDVVAWQGSTWASLRSSNVANAPDGAPTFWGVLAQVGAAGPQGVQGVAGPTGPQGMQGVAGPAGAAGPQGSVGQQGPAGSQGLTGPQGAKGETGSQGLPGPAGAAGSQGVAGPQGPQGPQGLTGLPGAAGPTGLTMRGGYRAGTNYGVGDGVLWNGSGYVSLAAGNVGNVPDQSTGQWLMFASAGSQGANGAQGPAGAAGAVGLTGATGPQGPAGPTGATGSQGPPVANYTGTYHAATNYAQNDAVSYQGSTYVSLVAGNHGNVPDQSPQLWAVLAAQGTAGPAGGLGATGATGPKGPVGPTGATGPQGPAGLTGATGLPGINFRGAWVSTLSYAVNDAVADGGSSWIAVQSSTGVEPGPASGAWSLLAQAGAPGSAGGAGAAATVSIGSVATGAPGTSAVVTNSGTAQAAVLNFTIPAGATGSGSSGDSGSGSGTSGVPFMSVQHSVQFGVVYFPVTAATGASSETPATLTWVPGGCTATSMLVYSLQANPLTVTLRSGMPGAMSSTGLSCVAANASSCTASGSVTVSAGSFVDFSITGSNGTASPVWTALKCD